jgi:hypothetical protein
MRRLRRQRAGRSCPSPESTQPTSGTQLAHVIHFRMLAPSLAVVTGYPRLPRSGTQAVLSRRVRKDSRE